jgi:hypothetical protein
LRVIQRKQHGRPNGGGQTRIKQHHVGDSIEVDGDRNSHCYSGNILWQVNTVPVASTHSHLTLVESDCDVIGQ